MSHVPLLYFIHVDFKSQKLEQIWLSLCMSHCQLCNQPTFVFIYGCRKICIYKCL